MGSNKVRYLEVEIATRHLPRFHKDAHKHLIVKSRPHLFGNESPPLSGDARTTPLQLQGINLQDFETSVEDLGIKPTAEELAEAAGRGKTRKALVVWYTRLNELASYKRIHGDTNVPQKYPPNPRLGVWVNKQRMEKKFLDEGLKSSMTTYRIQALTSLDFLWAKRKGDHSWSAKFRELVQYKEKYGNVQVPTKYEANKALGRWVSTQRSQYKLWLKGFKSHMTIVVRDTFFVLIDSMTQDQRYNRLVDVGFSFEMNQGTPHDEGPSMGEHDEARHDCSEDDSHISDSPEEGSLASTGAPNIVPTSQTSTSVGESVNSSVEA